MGAPTVNTVTISKTSWIQFLFIILFLSKVSKRVPIFILVDVKVNANRQLGREGLILSAEIPGLAAQLY